MTTTHELCNVLADALGMGREVVKAHARALHEAGLFDGDDAGNQRPPGGEEMII